MLIPLTRKTVETLIPAVATGEQYKHYWGKPQDLLKRLLISVTALTVVLVIGAITRDNEISGFCRFIFGIATGLYWFWYPIYGASLRNRTYRRYPYGGLWQGEVLDAFVTEELVGKEETVNKRGELVVVEDRERRINLEVGDDSGFRTLVQAPFLRDHKTIYPGMPVQLLLLSQEKNLSRISKISDAYLPNRDLWIGEYPYLRRDTFLEVSQRVMAEVAPSMAGDWRSQPIEADRYGYVATPNDRPSRRNGGPKPRRNEGRRPPRGAGDWGDDRGYQGQGYTDRGYDDRGYPAQGYDDRGYEIQDYPAQGSETRGYPAQGYDNRSDYEPSAKGRGYPRPSASDWDTPDRSARTQNPDDFRPQRPPARPSRRLDDRRYDPQDYADFGAENSRGSRPGTNPSPGDRGYDDWGGNDRANPAQNPPRRPGNSRNRPNRETSWGYGNDRENTTGTWDTGWGSGTQGYSAHQSSSGEVWNVSATEPVDLAPEEPPFDRPPVQIPNTKPRQSRQPLNLRYPAPGDDASR